MWETGTATITIDGVTLITPKLYPQKEADPKSKVLADFVDEHGHVIRTAFICMIWWDVCQQWSEGGTGRNPVFRTWKGKDKYRQKRYRAKRCGSRAALQASLTLRQDLDFVLGATLNNAQQRVWGSWVWMLKLPQYLYDNWSFGCPLSSIATCLLGPKGPLQGTRNPRFS